MLTEDDRQAAAEAIWDAGKSRDTCVAPSRIFPGMTMEDAYDIQARWTQLRLGDGARIAGRKIGLATRPMQAAARVAGPDCGVIFQDALFADGAEFGKGTFALPQVSAELVFTLGADLSGPEVARDAVLAAIATVGAALEITDSRTEQPATIIDTVSDNAGLGAVVTGGTPLSAAEVDLRWIAAVLSKNGTVEETGVSAALGGDPLAGLAWLAGRLAAAGEGLKAGDLVLGGGFTRPVPVRAGDAVLADFGPLGTISARFG
ncbi:2-keto-4-pentenoate hydratase [Mangrovicoccus sp. HB161399]|uniref:2-keto-4-pentenoate hydratase n=1 Tax=Mangrovicoccus sp. HB161399 TaxID=2720392 RepID=UPI001556A395|nr:fumarylacetoacetate hydrolase family protein [Mangrovicoccus sp. HB161399]